VLNAPRQVDAPSQPRIAPELVTIESGYCDPVDNTVLLRVANYSREIFVVKGNLCEFIPIKTNDQLNPYPEL
jgi:hypothetical protein